MNKKIALNLLNFIIRISRRLKAHKIKEVVSQTKENIILCEISKIVSSCKESEYKTTKNKIIWVYWQQGFDNSPDIVKRCLSSIKVNSDGFDVIELDINNVSDYVSIPENIKNKLKNNTITPTHYSDVVRFALLSEHGGMWIDSTYLITKKITSLIPEDGFFTLRSDYKKDNPWVPKGRWSCNFIQFNKGDPIAKSIYNTFIRYWERNNTILDYFLLDYIILYHYKNKKNFMDEVEGCKRSGENIHILSQMLKQENIAKNDLLRIENDTIGVYKLSYKENYITDNSAYRKYILR